MPPICPPTGQPLPGPTPLIIALDKLARNHPLTPAEAIAVLNYMRLLERQRVVLPAETARNGR